MKLLKLIKGLRIRKNSQSVQLSLFGQNITKTPFYSEADQLNLFEGGTKQFGANDLRQLRRVKSGVLRWVDADKENKENKEANDKKSQTGKTNNAEQTDTKGDETKNINAKDEQIDLFTQNPSKDKVGDEISKIASDPIIAREIEKRMKEEGIEINKNLSLQERVELYLRQKQEGNTFSKDTGQRVGGAKKEMYALRNQATLEKINQLLEQDDKATAYKLAMKQRIFEFDPDKLTGQDYHPNAIIFAKFIYDSLPAKPPQPTKQGIREYVGMLKKMAEFIEANKNESDISKLENKFLELIRLIDPSNTSHPLNDAVKRLKNKVLYKKHYLYFTQDKNAQDGETQKSENRSGEQESISGSEESDDTEGHEKKGEGKNKFESPKLDMIIRKNGRLVELEDVLPEKIREKYGFKYVEFGHYVKDQEAKIHLKHFLASLNDLEDALDIDLKSFIQDHQLSIAFGSRGSGKAAAHYEPLANIINLTKTRGNGSVAHEFGHFIDYSLYKMLVGDRDQVQSAVKEMKKKRSLVHSRRYAPDKTKYDDIYYALRNILNGMYENRKAREEMELIQPSRSTRYFMPRARDTVRFAKTLKENLERLKPDLMHFVSTLDKEDWRKITNTTFDLRQQNGEIIKRSADFVLNALEQGNRDLTKEGWWKNEESIIDIITPKEKEERLSWLEQKINNFDPVTYSIVAFAPQTKDEASYLAKEWGNAISVPMKTYDTKFSRDSKQAGEYWARTEEMFARAFESYVQDKLGAKNMQNNYLVFNNKLVKNIKGDKDIEWINERGHIYPQLEEREELVQLFDVLFDALRREYPRKATEEQRMDETFDYNTMTPRENLFKSLRGQLNLFGGERQLHEGDIKFGKTGHRLVLKNHRWHLGDEYNTGGFSKQPPPWEQPTEYSKDPDQLSLLDTQHNAPLSKVKQTLDDIEGIKNDIKESHYNTMAGYIVKSANKQRVKFLGDMDAVAQANHLDLPSERFGDHAIKSPNRLIEDMKLQEKTGKISNIKDALRTTIVVNSREQIPSIIDSIKKKGYEIHSVFDTLSKDKKGYRDVRVYLVTSEADPLIKEVRLIQPNMLRTRDSIGFDIEDIKNNIDEVIPNLNDIPIAKSLIDKAITILGKIIDELYDKAYILDNNLPNTSEDNQLNLDLTYPSPAKISDNKSDLDSSSLKDIFRKSLKERFGKQIWEPIKAKLYASSKVIPSNAGEDKTSPKIDLISDSIIQPLKELFKKYNADYLLDNSIDNSENFNLT